MELLWLFLIFLRASILSVNGQTALPILRQDLVATGITTDQAVIEALTIGRLGTGPGGLYIVALGFFIAGWLGAFAALVATLLPPLLVLPVSSWLRPRLAQPHVNGAIRGLALATSGLVIVTSVLLLLAIGDGGLPDGWQVALVGGAYVLSLDGRLHPLWLIIGGAVVGIAVATLGA